MLKRFKLRPYQKAAVTAVVSRYRKLGVRRMLLHLPTGAGKTVIATFIIKELLASSGFGRILFVAHRQEILDQTARTIKQQLPRLTIQIEQGDRRGDGTAHITIASVQSLVGRKERYDPSRYSLVICDECHRALAPSWGEVIEYFHTRVSRETLLLGMTATPRRTDGRSALDVFGEVAFHISRAELEDLGYLVPMRYFMIRSDLNLGGVKMTGGDFQVGALSRVMDQPALRALAVQAWLEKGRGKKTIAFCAGVDHALHLAEDFTELGLRAEKIDGKTRDRETLLDRFARGEIDVITNYGVLTEGFDDPAVECILMARPTTSPLVYTQCLGRGLRPWPDKRACVVIDMVDRNTHQLQYGATQMAGLSHSWHSKGRDPFREARSLAGIKVTSPAAFLKIKKATSLEEVQSILMNLPPEIVVAGLDGEPVLRYEAALETPSVEAATKNAREFLMQVRARFKKIECTEDELTVKFKHPELDNERYSHLQWHLERVTGRDVVFVRPERRRHPSSPRALLRSMLPTTAQILKFEIPSGEASVSAVISGLMPEEMEDVVTEFQAESGLSLNLKGQLSLF
ncbi:MAG: DEAD/DEAH box helicase [Myxococcota bacterium]|nr:DEAD/DEAH box helicase [Myxococcota bacterium]